MEKSGNKGLGSTMQSDTSLHDSVVKWWDGCEAKTLPFNEGLSLVALSCHRTLFLPKKEPVILLSLFSHFSCIFRVDGGDMDERCMGFGGGTVRCEGGWGESVLNQKTFPQYCYIPHCPLTYLCILFSCNPLSEVHGRPQSDLLITVGQEWQTENYLHGRFEG